MIRVVTGDCLSPTKGLILHQTNTSGVMGAGIALQIKQKWPDAFSEYVLFCGKRKPADLIGTVQFTQLTDDLWLGNLFCQGAPGPKATVYEAYPKVLREVVSEFSDEEIHIPYGIGCGLAGGDWDVVFPMLEFYLKPIQEVNIWHFVPPLPPLSSRLPASVAPMGSMSRPTVSPSTSIMRPEARPISTNVQSQRLH